MTIHISNAGKALSAYGITNVTRMHFGNKSVGDKEVSMSAKMIKIRERMLTS